MVVVLRHFQQLLERVFVLLLTLLSARGWVWGYGDAGDGSGMGMIYAERLEHGQLDDMDVAVMRSYDLVMVS